jgi:hypothetical protein
MKQKRGKGNSRNETRKKFTKRTEILHLTKQNKTKRNEISLFFVFRETSEISRNKLFVSLCFVFRETKKGREMETIAEGSEKVSFSKQEGKCGL